MGTSDDLITSTELRRTEFYADYGRPNNIFYVSWTVIEQNERYASGLALIRPEDATQFTREQVALLTMLTPHLAKAFRLQRVIERATANNQAVLTSVAQFDFAVIALDYDGRITNISAPAKALLDARDGVRARGCGRPMRVKTSCFRRCWQRRRGRGRTPAERTAIRFS